MLLPIGVGFIASLAAAEFALVGAQFGAGDHVLGSLQPVGVIVGLAETLAKNAFLLQDSHWLNIQVDEPWSASVKRVLEFGGQFHTLGKHVYAVFGVVLGIAPQNGTGATAGAALHRGSGLFIVGLLVLAIIPSKSRS